MKTFLLFASVLLLAVCIPFVAVAILLDSLHADWLANLLRPRISK